LSEKRLYLHLFHNGQRAVDDKALLNALLDQLEEELLTGKPDPAHEKLYSKYFVVKETPARGVKLTPKQDAINAAEKTMVISPY